MPTPTSHRTRARQAAIKRMRELGLTYTQIAAKVGDITRQTVSAFLRGETWPQDSTLTKLDRALDWEPGTIARIALGGPAPGDPTQQDLRTLEIGLPDDLSPEEIAEVRAAVEAAAFERARAIRASRRT